MKALERIRAEYQRQKDVEGFSDGQDDAYTNNELLRAADAYRNAFGPDAALPDDWPWDSSWWKPRSRVRNLERAAALYMAEGARRSRDPQEPAARLMAMSRKLDDCKKELEWLLQP